MMDKYVFSHRVPSHQMPSDHLPVAETAVGS